MFWKYFNNKHWCIQFRFCPMVLRYCKVVWFQSLTSVSQQLVGMHLMYLLLRLCTTFCYNLLLLVEALTPWIKFRKYWQQGSQLALWRAEIAHIISNLVCCLFETFRWDLKWDVLFETFWNFSNTLGGCLFETFR